MTTVHNSRRKPPTKAKKAIILDKIRELLQIPSEVSRGGHELRGYLKRVPSEDLKMAKIGVQDLMDEYFPGKSLSNEKLYRWAQSNKKPHKGSYVATEENEKIVRDQVNLLLKNGRSRKDIETEICHLIKKLNPNFKENTVSKSFLSRLLKEPEQEDFSSFEKGFKKLKTEAMGASQSNNIEIPFVEISPSQFNGTISTQPSPQDQSCLEEEVYFNDIEYLQRDANRTMELFESFPDVVAVLKAYSVDEIFNDNQY